MQSVETFRTGFEALKGLAKASADETARENEALRLKLAEYEQEETVAEHGPERPLRVRE